MATPARRPPTLTFARAWADFELHCRAENMSPRTISAYLAAATQLREFLAGRDHSTNPDEITRRDVQAFLTDLITRYADSTAATRYWGLRSFFGWLVDEGELEHSPLDRVKPPRQTERPPDVLDDDEVRALLRASEGRSFEARRDAAMVRLLFDSGIRVGELISMRLDQLDLRDGRARVSGKGRRERDVAFGARTASDLARYLRVRDAHPQADSDAVWLGRKGALTESGVGQALKERALPAGLHPNRHPPPALAPYLGDP